METFEAIQKRASLKARLSAREIEPWKIARVLEAARLAPSSRNRQPWRFVVVKGKDAVVRVVEGSFRDANQVAKEAPVVIIACANPADDETVNGQEIYLFDVALAVENLVLAATDLGLVTHLMRAVDEDKLKNLLGLPAEVRFVIATPLAYPIGRSYEEAAQERLGQRTRKDAKEVVYLNTWGSAF